MKKLCRATLFTLVFAMIMAVLSVALYKLDIPWLSPEFITPSLCAVLAVSVSLTPNMRKFLNGEN